MGCTFKLETSLIQNDERHDAIVVDMGLLMNKINGEPHLQLAAVMEGMTQGIVLVENRVAKLEGSYRTLAGSSLIARTKQFEDRVSVLEVSCHTLEDSSLIARTKQRMRTISRSSSRSSRRWQAR